VSGIGVSGVVDLLTIRALEAILVPPCASLTTVPILTDDHAILANLSVPILFREGEAQIPGTVLVSGFILPGGGGTDHVVASHGVEWVDLLSIGASQAIPDALLCQFLCCHIVWDFDTIHWTLPVDLKSFPVTIKVEQVSILFARITCNKLIECGVSRIFTITTL